MGKKMKEKADSKKIFKGMDGLPKMCYVCGRSHSRPEGDELPPKCLFPQQYWSNLITVPICEGCHDGFKNQHDKDIEYFRDYVAMWSGKNVPNEIQQKRNRSWVYAPNHKVATKKNVEHDWRKTRSALIVPEKVLKAEMKRINPVLEHIVRGYHFSRFEERIPENVKVIILKEPFGQKVKPAIDEYYRMTVGGDIGMPNLFTFRFCYLQNGCNESI
jgi:hypothetical protein